MGRRRSGAERSRRAHARRKGATGAKGAAASPQRRRRVDAFPRFGALDGRHPFKAAVPGGFVDYPARRRRDGDVAFFNFALAREMGLIPRAHPDRLTPALRRRILDTFALVIVNEYDVARRRRVPARDRLPGRYMATRYLQLQHPGRRGETSGDGRSIWNGCVEHRGVTWDVSSCGTGVTRLCPATASEGRFFPTGNSLASYGCGTAALEEGVGAALMSEVFHRSGIATERVLAVIALPGGLAINVRAARSLVRPSHLFVHLHQGRLDRLRGVADLYVERRMANGDWPRVSGDERYRVMARETARTFARMAATFEREYVFCWLDWDGDNILADGGIIDYGSVRQFGLFHRDYRFDDVDRMSTTIPEQRRKARHIVQKFAQIRDALITGRRRPLRAFARDPILALFDREFERTRRRLLLRQIGFDDPSVDSLLARPPAALARFESAFRTFERARSSRGPVRVPDGLSWNAVFCMRDVLRRLPRRLRGDPRPLPAEAFLELALSSYASRSDRRATPYRRRRARGLQTAYLELIECAARRSGTSRDAVLDTVAARSATINRRSRITGDAIDSATQRLVRSRGSLRVEDLTRLVELFAERHATAPRRPGARTSRRPPAPPAPRLRRLLAALHDDVECYREGL